MMIRNIENLADHLGAWGATESAIKKRIYKDTQCGCSSSVSEDQPLEKCHRNYLRTYVVQVRSGIGGSYVIAWRKEHGKKHYIRSGGWGIPPALAEYLGLRIYDMRKGHSSNHYNHPRIGEEWVDREELRKEFGIDFLRGLKPDTHSLPFTEGTVRVTRQGCSTYLTVRVMETKDATPHGTVFSVAGYCEGTDQDCEPHEVLLPCKPGEIDEAIADADKDGCRLWNETHGCEKCWPDGYCDEWGNEWSPEEDNWVGQPINSECKTCNGIGTII